MHQLIPVCSFSQYGVIQVEEDSAVLASVEAKTDVVLSVCVKSFIYDLESFVDEGRDRLV